MGEAKRKERLRALRVIGIEIGSGIAVEKKMDVGMRLESISKLGFWFQIKADARFPSSWDPSPVGIHPPWGYIPHGDTSRGAGLPV